MGYRLSGGNSRREGGFILIRIEQVKVPFHHTIKELPDAVCKQLRIQPGQLLFHKIIKKSIDARKKPLIYAVYTVDVKVQEENKVMHHCKNKNASIVKKHEYTFPANGTNILNNPPVIIGSGPAGLFCAYMLAKQGYKPILLERGGNIAERMAEVEHFWDTSTLDTASNVQFGEGGAGTFSDGKLNTMTKDKEGRGKKVLELFVEHGAPEEILYLNKPHIGTDILSDVVASIRRDIIRMGGDVRFHHQVVNMHIENDILSSLTVEATLDGKKESYQLETTVAILAIGHSARDTFQMLYENHIPMESKSFAVGLRVEHPQEMINESQYGEQTKEVFPAADYKLTTQTENGRGVYSFCMCPGGYVVNSSSEEQSLCVNGMSYHDRAGENANSAIVVTVSKDDFESTDPLAGIAFQRALEEKAYAIGKGAIPVQCFKDFCDNKPTETLGQIYPQIKGAYALANVRSIFPEEINQAIEEGMKQFDRKIRGFAREDALLSGVESRTSSPIRITRNDIYESAVKGLYPCGEGAGYAGGITSAAIDGIKIAEIIAKTFRTFD